MVDKSVQFSQSGTERAEMTFVDRNNGNESIPTHFRLDSQTLNQTMMSSANKMHDGSGESR